MSTTEPVQPDAAGSGPEVLAEAAQRAAGVIAARARGDHAGAEELLAWFPSEACKTSGFFLLADLTMGLLARQSDQSVEQVAADLSLYLATVFPGRST